MPKESTSMNKRSKVFYDILLGLDFRNPKSEIFSVGVYDP